jgi:hypothetical protein
LRFLEADGRPLRGRFRGGFTTVISGGTPMKSPAPLAGAALFLLAPTPAFAKVNALSSQEMDSSFAAKPVR